MNNLVNLFANLNIGGRRGARGQNYSLIFHEALDAATQNDAMMVCTVVDQIVNVALGDYGSVNLGVGGAIYSQIRDDLTEIVNGTYVFPAGVNGGNCPNLCAYLATPGQQLPQYGGSGAGGAGQHKVQLNQCVRTVKENIAVIRGVLLLQSRAQNWNALNY